MAIFFLKTTGFLLKFLIWTEFPNIPNWKPAKKTKKNLIRCGLGAKFGPNYVQCYEESKETGNVIRFFSYFTWGLPFKESAKLCGLHGLMGWMGGMGPKSVWVTWVAWVYKILVRVKKMAWVAWVHEIVLWKRLLKILQNSQENICARVSS